MADNRTLTYTVKAVADISDVQSNVQNLKSILKNLKLPDTIAQSFEKSFGSIEKDIEKAQIQMNKGFKTKGDVSNFERSMANIATQIGNIGNKINGLDLKKLKNFDFNVEGFENINSEIDDLQKRIKQLKNTGIKVGTIDASTLDALEKELGRSNTSMKELRENAGKKLDSSNLKGLEKNLVNLQKGLAIVEKEYESLGGDKLAPDNSVRQKYEAYLAVVNMVSDTIKEIKTNTTNIGQLKDILDQKEIERFQMLQGMIQKEIIPGFEELEQDVRKFSNQEQQAAQQTQKLNSGLDQLTSRVISFFGLTNGVQLLRRAFK